MPRAVTLVRSICLALVLGVLVLHIPLDAFRTRAEGCLADACCAATADDPTAPACDDCGCVPPLELEAASTPVPGDGCDQGCHCGCCGGLPLSVEAGPALASADLGARSTSTDRPGARRDRPLEVFHPPRA